MTPAAIGMHSDVLVKERTRNRFIVPVFPHIKKFILKNYQTTDIVKVEEYTILGKAVTLALRDNRSRSEHNDQHRDRLTETITLILTSEQSKLGPRLSKLIRINTDMDRLFKDHLITWIYAFRAAGIATHPACKMYLEHYGIDENEYSLEAAYRFWQRAKDRNSKWASWNH